MRKAQFSIFSLIIGFLLVFFIIVFLPVIYIFISNTLADTSAGYTGGEYFFMYMIPALMVLAGIVGLFLWNSR